MIERPLLVLFNGNAETQVSNTEELKRLVVATRDGKVIRLSDIAKVTLEKSHDIYRASANGREAVVMAVNAAPTANPINNIISGSIRVIKLATTLLISRL